MPMSRGVPRGLSVVHLRLVGPLNPEVALLNAYPAIVSLGPRRDHTIRRKVISHAWTPRAVAKLEDRISQAGQGNGWLLFESGGGE